MAVQGFFKSDRALTFQKSVALQSYFSDLKQAEILEAQKRNDVKSFGKNKNKKQSQEKIKHSIDEMLRLALKRRLKAKSMGVF